MDSSGAASSKSSGSGLRISGSEENFVPMDPRKRKRMISNRESARRSRLRKQNHLDGLMSQVARFKKDNEQILSGLNVTAQLYLSVEAENAILRSQAAELNHRLRSLTQIISMLSAAAEPAWFMNYLCTNQSQTIMAAAVADSYGPQ